MRTRAPVLLLLLLVSAQGVLHAQRRPRPSDSSPGEAVTPPRFFVGGGLWISEPTGSFGRTVDTGWGLDANGRYALDEAGAVSLRADVGFVQYGSERRTVCFGAPIGCRIQVDLTTSNNIFLGGFGPEVAYPGRVVRPYGYGELGFAYFSTSSSLSGVDEADDFADTENFGDGTLAWRAGGGLEVRIRGGPRPIWLDLGADYHGNGVVEYLTEGDIQDNPDGSITLHPNRTDANLTTFRIGVRVGIRGDGPDRDRGWNPWP